LQKITGLVVGPLWIPTDGEAQKTAAPVREGELKTLTRLEYDTLDAICARLIPTDEIGPGAREAKAARYIDWGLSGALNVRNAREQYASALAAVGTMPSLTRAPPSHSSLPPIRTPSSRSFRTARFPAFLSPDSLHTIGVRYFPILCDQRSIEPQGSAGNEAVERVGKRKMSRLLDIHPLQGNDTEPGLVIERTAPLLERLEKADSPKFRQQRDLPKDHGRNEDNRLSCIRLIEDFPGIPSERSFSNKRIVHESVRVCDVHYLPARSRVIFLIRSALVACVC